MNGCSSPCVSQVSSVLLWLWSEEAGSRFGAIAGTKGVISEEPAAPRSGFGENDADHRGKMGELCRKMVMTVSKQAEGRAETDCWPEDRGGHSAAAPRPAEAPTPREATSWRGRDERR